MRIGYRDYVAAALHLRTILLLSVLCQICAAVDPDCPAKCTCQDNWGLEIHCSEQTEEEVKATLANIPRNTLELFILGDLNIVDPCYTWETPHHRKMENSQLEVFPRLDLIELPDLEQLILSSNHISRLPDGVFGNMTRLTKLDLRNNEIEDLQKNLFQGLKSVHTLILSNNRIRRLPDDVFGNMTSLTKLRLTANKIDEISTRSFRGLSPNIQMIHLGENRITSEMVAKMKTTLDQLSDLSLFLNDNLLTSIPNLTLQAFRKIHLENNSISTIDPSFEKPIKELGLDKIILHSNPFYCNCHIMWFLSFLQKQNTEFLAHSEEPRCHEPTALKSMPMKDVKLSALTCECPNGTINGGIYGCVNACPSMSVNVGGVCLCSVGYTPAAGKAKRNNIHQTFCKCNQGFSELHGRCQECPRNYYKDSVSNGMCTRCPDISVSPPGSTNASQCRCLHGHDAVRSTSNETVCINNNTNKNDNSVSSYSMTEGGMYLVAPLVGGLLATVVLLGAVAVFARLMIYRYPCKRLFGGVYPSSSNNNNRAPGRRINQENILYEGFREHLVQETDIFSEIHFTPTSDGPSNLPSVKYQKEAKEWELPRQTLKIGQLLGEGAFGLVYEGWAQSKETTDPVKVAVKTIRGDATREEWLSLKLEMEQLIFVGHHPNVIQLLGACTRGGRFMVVLEYAKHGNLLNYLRNKSLSVVQTGLATGSVSGEKDLLTFAWHVAKGMSHLESMKCLHRDLAARNVLIFDNMVAKVCDFGLSREAYESGYYRKQSQERVPFKWMSIESLLDGKYTTKSDVWSYGIVLWEIATLGGTPYPAIGAKNLFDVLKSGYRMQKPELCDDDMYDVMRSCWRELPDERPTFRELCDMVDNLLQKNTNCHYIELQDNQSIMCNGKDREMESHIDGDAGVSSGT